MKKILLNILVLVIILQTVIYPINSQASQYSHDSSIYPSSEININNFENFVIKTNSTNIDSTRTISNITMLGSSGVGSENQYENYYLFLDSVGSFTDFDVSVDIDYSYAGSMLLSLHLSVGSYYTESGEYHGTPLEGYHDSICQSYLQDAWSGSGGKFGFRCTPYEIPEYQATNYGTLPTSGVYTLGITRTNNTLTGYILQDETIVFSYSWSDGVSRPLNCITILGIVVPMYTDNTIGVFRNLNATLVSPDISTYHFGFTFSFYMISSVMIAISIIIIKKRKN